MNNDKLYVPLWFFLFALVVMAILSCVSHARQDANTRDLAISHQCGQYNPKTGDFEWIDSPSAPDFVTRAMPVPQPDIHVTTQPKHKVPR